MIKFKNTFFYFIFIYFVFLNVANAYEISVANKYNDIFDKKIINSSDVENYRKIYLFQEDCKWKKANKYINIFLIIPPIIINFSEKPTKSLGIINPQKKIWQVCKFYINLIL